MPFIPQDHAVPVAVEDHHIALLDGLDALALLPSGTPARRPLFSAGSGQPERGQDVLTMLVVVDV